MKLEGRSPLSVSAIAWILSFSCSLSYILFLCSLALLLASLCVYKDRVWLSECEKLFSVRSIVSVIRTNRIKNLSVMHNEAYQVFLLHMNVVIAQPCLVKKVLRYALWKMTSSPEAYHLAIFYGIFFHFSPHKMKAEFPANKFVKASKKFHFIFFFSFFIL